MKRTILNTPVTILGLVLLLLLAPLTSFLEPHAYASVENSETADLNAVEPIANTSLQNGCVINPISNGQRVDGSLGDGDCRVDNRFADQFSVNGVAGQQISVTLEATISPRLVLRRSNGIVLAEGNSFSMFARLVFTPTSTEPLILEATSRFGDGERGNYTLIFFLPNCNPVSITSGQIFDGQLTSNDCVSDDSFTDRYSFNNIAGQQINATIFPSESVLVLTLKRVNGILLARGTTIGSRSERLSFTLNSTEPLILEVGSFSSFRTTNYSLSFSLGPDFNIGFEVTQVFIDRGANRTIPLFINRIGGLTGNITIESPSTKGTKLKITPGSAQITNNSSINFNIRVNRQASAGIRELLFTARDNAGRVRTARLMVIVN
jgi:hypothetical protein